MSDLVERVVQMLIQDFQHCDCDTGQCSSYEFRTKGQCACRDGAMRAIAIVLEEAARVVTEHYQELSAEHRLLLLNRAAAIRALGDTHE